jgi:hypothetical protein
MRFYTAQHRFYCGVDLHARTMYLCILDHAGQVVFDKNLPATSRLQPYPRRKPGPSRKALVACRLSVQRGELHFFLP